MSKFLWRGTRGSRAPYKRKGHTKMALDSATAGNRFDWERVARERVEDDRLRLRGGAAPDGNVR